MPEMYMCILCRHETLGCLLLFFFIGFAEDKVGIQKRSVVKIKLHHETHEERVLDYNNK